MQFMSYRSLQIVTIFILLLFLGCSENQLPTCEILSPHDGITLEKGTVATISADANDPDGTITELRFFVDDSLIGMVDDFPYNYQWDTKDYVIGLHRLRILAKDDLGAEVEDEVEINFITAASITPIDSVDEVIETKPPTDIILSDTVIHDSFKPSIFVGTFTTIDEDSADYHNYSLGPYNTDDNSYFYIRDDQLYTSWNFFYDVRLDYSISISSTDGAGNSYTKKFQLSVKRDVFKTRAVNDGIGCYDAENLFLPEYDLYWQKIIQSESGKEYDSLDFSAEFQIYTTSYGGMTIAFHVQDSSMVTSNLLEEQDFIDIFISSDTASHTYADNKYSMHVKLFRSADERLKGYYYRLESEMAEEERNQWHNVNCANVIDLGTEYYVVITLKFPVEFLRFNIGVTNHASDKTKDVLWWYSNKNAQNSSPEMQRIFVSHFLVS